jgi:peptide/nickel transport system substrate-binding protein
MAPTDVHELGNLTRTGAEQLRRAGMNVDLLEVDFANVIRRRANQSPPDKGGYNVFCTLIDRSLPNIHPYGNLAIRADGKEVINGWANNPKIEELRTAWLDAADLPEQKRLCTELQKRLWIDVPFIPLGEYWQASAYRNDLTDIIPGCFTTFYGVRRPSATSGPLSGRFLMAGLGANQSTAAITRRNEGSAPHPHPSRLPARGACGALDRSGRRAVV